MYPIPPIDEARLVSLVMDPTTTTQRWADDAACAHTPAAADAYFPEAGELPPADALARCSECPVAAECLATALVHESHLGDRHGWWGGMSPDARDDTARRLDVRGGPVEPEVGGPATVARHLRSQSRTIPSIAAALGCTERTVYRYLRHTAA